MDRHGLVCRTVLEQPDITQREMAQKLKVSLGTANGLIKECIGMGYIAERGRRSRLRMGAYRGREAPAKRV